MILTSAAQELDKVDDAREIETMKELGFVFTTNERYPQWVDVRNKVEYDGCILALQKKVDKPIIVREGSLEIYNDYIE